MLTPAEATDRTADLVSPRRAAPEPTAADAVFSGGESTLGHRPAGRRWRMPTAAEGLAIGLRVFVGQRQASVSTATLDPADLQTGWRSARWRWRARRRRTPGPGWPRRTG